MPPPQASRPTLLALVAALLTALVLATSACSSGSSSASSSPSAGGSTASDDAAPPPIVTKVALGKVSGIAAKKARARFQKASPTLRTRVGKAVDEWFDGAFVTPSYPTDEFPDAFDSFTARAAALAEKQPRLMTNATLGPDISGLSATKRRVTLDVLAPGGAIAATTARFRLVFRTSGDTERKVTVSGSLFLTRDPHGRWRIFGYDVSKGASG